MNVADDLASIMQQCGIQAEVPKAVRKKKAVRKGKKKAAPKAPHPAVVWPEDLVPDDFIQTDYMEYAFDIWQHVKRAIMVFTGPAGTGKTTTAFAVAHQMGRWVLHHQCKADECASMVIGTPGISFKTVDGVMEGGDYLRHGPLYLAAWISKEFGVEVLLYLNEVNMWPPSNCTALNSMGDDCQSFYSAYTGERIEWESPRIIMDFNAGYTGTREMNEALRDRFHTVYFEYLDTEDEKKIVMSRTNMSEHMAERMVQCLRALREAASGKRSDIPRIKFDPSLRLVLDAAECIEHGMDINKAWAEAVYGRIGYEPRFAETRKVVCEICRVAEFDIAEA